MPSRDGMRFDVSCHGMTTLTLAARLYKFDPTWNHSLQRLDSSWVYIIQSGSERTKIICLQRTKIRNAFNLECYTLQLTFKLTIFCSTWISSISKDSQTQFRGSETIHCVGLNTVHLLGGAMILTGTHIYLETSISQQTPMIYNHVPVCRVCIYIYTYTYLHIYIYTLVNGNSRILKWRYLPYINGLFLSGQISGNIPSKIPLNWGPMAWHRPRVLTHRIGDGNASSLRRSWASLDSSRISTRRATQTRAKLVELIGLNI